MVSIHRCACGVRVLGTPSDICRSCQVRAFPDTAMIFKHSVDEVKAIALTDELPTPPEPTVAPDEPCQDSAVCEESQEEYYEEEQHQEVDYPLDGPPEEEWYEEELYQEQEESIEDQE